MSDKDLYGDRSGVSINSKGSPSVGQVPPSSPSTSASVPLPRPARKPKRSKDRKGLPEDHALGNLARDYLIQSRKLFPLLANAGLIPEPADGVITQIVEDFKHRHCGGKVDVDEVKSFTPHCTKLAGMYLRYSCDNSSPTSIQDQMHKCLTKASSEGRFVPWHYIYCDYSVSGLDSSRQGYTSYKAILRNEKHLIETTYIDDFTGASRDEVEWYNLANLSKRYNKRLIGASDSFDLASDSAEVLMGAYNMVNITHRKSLKEKVTRGMQGAARRGTCVGLLSLGFTRQEHRDEAGHVVKDAQGQPIYERCHDPDTYQYRRTLYELYYVKSWFAYRISRHFNELKVDGSDRWTERSIKQLLANPDAIGVIIWNKSRRFYDREQGKYIVIRNSRSEWIVRYDPALAIIPMEWWRGTQRKLTAMRRASPLTGKPLSRNEVSATTLLSGTLFCGYCGEELHLTRSTAKYKQFGCPNGIRHAAGCKLSSSKSTRIIEDNVLNGIQQTVLTCVQVEKLVGNANDWLKREAEKPRIDTKPWNKELRQKEDATNKLFARLQKQTDEALCQAYDKQIAELQTQINSLRLKIGKAQAEELPSLSRPNCADSIKNLPIKEA